ncbi:MAG: glycoside hydrolase family 3 C-terminal domain-containing protein, partial [Bacteroidia bacterium]|nr:glycoside hydrolase family 3 C-terminal domain-containing protein [Bacteroidia bacterium]
MFKLRYILVGVLFLIIESNTLILGQTIADSKPLYRNPDETVDVRVKDLIARMTPEEKVGQLSVLLGWEMYQKEGENVIPANNFILAIKQRNPGMLWATLRADPWTKKSLLTGLYPQQAAEATNALQKYVIENTRLGIPLLFAEECAHGHMAIGTTVFPTSIGQASTWDPELIQQMAAVIAKETRLQGAQIGYGPVLDLAREPRWSRVEETFGEDPCLTSEMGKAVVKGFQGKNLKSGVNVVSTLKHFIAYGISDGGQNGGSVAIGNRELAQYYMPPFRAAIEAGALSVMTAYNSVDGIPNSSNKYLLTDVLRNQWRFPGFFVSDLGSIESLLSAQRVAGSSAEAAALAINAGLDADLGGNGFDKALLDAVNRRLVTMDVLDRAVSNVLRIKFEMGLFENSFVDPQKAGSEVRSSDNIEIARQVARESVILLKNNKSLLPLDKNIKSIAVIGPNADNMYNQLGDYTAPQNENNVVTVLKGIKNKVSRDTKVRYIKGCAIRDTLTFNIKEAVEAAKNSQVVILVLGGSSARDFKTKYENTGAARVSGEKEKVSISDMESGEGFDRVSLDLMGKQLELAAEIVKTGIPVVAVLIKGRPLNLNWLQEHVPAIIDAWYPGQEGGTAIADVLFGDYNPAGRLPLSIPKSIGQLPVYYDYKAPEKHSYVEGDALPLYPFGYGLSYTKFDYSNLKIDVSEGSDSIRV